MSDLEKLKALRDRYWKAWKLIEAKAIQNAINILRGL